MKAERFAHWSLRYAFDRTRLGFYQQTHPRAPWLAPGAVAYLDRWLQTRHVGLEWGAGRSTLWFSRRVSHLTSIEHDRAWHGKVMNELLATPLNNVDLLLREPNPDKYLQPALDLPSDSLDFALIDGVSELRAECVSTAIPRIRPGGILIIDDVHRYLPSDSRSPRALPPGAEPASATWRAVADTLAGWVLTTTSSGVTDTAIFERPA